MAQNTNPIKTKVSHHTMQPLASYAFQPGGIRFETQEAEETVELFLRQHPIVNIPWILVSVLLLAAPILLFPTLFIVLKIPVPPGHMIVAMVFWYVATFGFILTNFLHWFFNIYIVTNERIVDIDFLYLLYKHSTVAELAKIQDISYTASGILATVFNYGNVMVETAGEIPSIDFEAVPHPDKVVETIRSLAEAAGYLKHDV